MKLKQFKEVAWTNIQCWRHHCVKDWKGDNIIVNDYLEKAACLHEDSPLIKKYPELKKCFKKHWMDQKDFIYTVNLDYIPYLAYRLYKDTQETLIKNKGEKK